ncbi:hypothetical protein [Streptomyces pactum]|uniref:hypothetical protein n=1 Tax=Streptomyces pactum TaxID=68249 RepID=UPI001E3454F0|nr:hypothetical protein [Streptomyces pactum]
MASTSVSRVVPASPQQVWNLMAASTPSRTGSPASPRALTPLAVALITAVLRNAHGA